VLLDGLRGIAAISVMSMHLWLGQGIWAGINTFVDFFFVLSGFVLEPQLANSQVGSFLLKRILRLYPMLIPVFFVMIVTDRVSVVSKALGTTLGSVQTSGLHYVGAFLLLQIFWGSIIRINGPLWSLSAEWFINIFAISFRMRDKIKFLLTVGFLIEIVGFYVNWRFQLGWDSVKYLMAIGRVTVGFYLGVKLRMDMKSRNSKSSAKTFLLVAFLVIFEFGMVDFSRLFIIFAAPVYYFTIREFARIDESHCPKPLLKFCSYLGRISYGIYVWHMVIGRIEPASFILKHGPIHFSGLSQEIFKVVFTLMTVLAVTEASIRFVELPIRIAVLNRLQNRIDVVD